MAVSTRNGEESKKIRKMSLSYLKDSIVRRSGRQNGPRARVCCCETLEDANGEARESGAYSTKDLSSDGMFSTKDLTSDGKGVRCKCTGRPLGDKHKLSIFKSLKKRFQLNTDICARSSKCQSNHTLSLTEDSCAERFVKPGLRKSKGGRAICPIPQQICFMKSSGASCDKSSTISLTSLQEQQEGVFRMRKLPDGNASTQLLMENVSNVALPALKNDVDPENEYRTGNYDMDSSNYSETSNFVFNVNGDNLLKYDSCDVRHPMGENSELVPSTSRSLTSEEKLLDLPDGAFLVRDSSADRYLLSVSFRSSGKTFHTRIEHSYGLFSFYSTPSGEGFSSIVELINHSMSYSESAVFCYSRPRAPGYPSFPVRLAKPVSRFTQVRSLQYLCRFVIRQYTRVDNIQKLPLPNRLKGYIQEGHY
ncbi:hypothetical protein L9F63_003386 [Diploptera punctata]|uniref:Suppressor of cytokine signaling 6 n=1 Tax=Diploptera punctata TaxID=6984 RepID=A0AAD7ZLC5_DIPPU|nr:hypothetical protein L9F63_003386 [Diploptera punctata]